MDVLGAFQSLGPQAATEDDTVNREHLLTLSAKFLGRPDNPALLLEWFPYKYLLAGAFRVKWEFNQEGNWNDKKDLGSAVLIGNQFDILTWPIFLTTHQRWHHRLMNGTVAPFLGPAVGLCIPRVHSAL